MLTSINTHMYNGEHSVTVNEDSKSVTIRGEGDLYSGITLFFRDHADLDKVAAVLREACNPKIARQPAGEQAPPSTPYPVAAASEADWEPPACTCAAKPFEMHERDCAVTVACIVRFGDDWLKGPRPPEALDEDDEPYGDVVASR